MMDTVRYAAVGQGGGRQVVAHHRRRRVAAVADRRRGRRRARRRLLLLRRLHSPALRSAGRLQRLLERSADMANGGVAGGRGGQFFWK